VTVSGILSLMEAKLGNSVFDIFIFISASRMDFEKYKAIALRITAKESPIRTNPIFLFSFHCLDILYILAG
ncbi:MAG: hypothetical protein AB2693_31945, partial [Candidatus Thiodiazotropha sp.]